MNISPSFRIFIRKVLGEPMLIPGVGQFVPFIDTEGNRAGMFQPILLG